MCTHVRVCVCVLYLTVYLLVFFFCIVNAPSLYCSVFFCFTPLVTPFFTQLLLKTLPWRLSQLFFFFYILSLKCSRRGPISRSKTGEIDP